MKPHPPVTTTGLRETASGLPESVIVRSFGLGVTDDEGWSSGSNEDGKTNDKVDQDRIDIKIATLRNSAG